MKNFFSKFSRHQIFLPGLLLPITSILVSPITLGASPSTALREYNAGKYDQALKEYERLLQKQTGDPRLHFNTGAAAYRNHRFDEAAKQFNDALASPDLNLQGRAYYNLGNSLYHLGESNPDPSKRTETWEKSLRGYESTLKLNPQDNDAKFNYEFVKKKLEELKQQQQKQEQNKSDQQKDQKQQQQQDQQQQKNQDEKKDQEQKKDQQKQDEKQKQEQQAANQSQQEKQKEQQAKQSSAQPKEKSDEKDQGQPAQTYAAAQMTPEQAQQLLDAQKGDETVLPIKPIEKPKQSNRAIKDW